ncbi:peptide ABC transporter substrate-binding protein [Haliovirga abyssi]|uniref:Peptide ABC transporter substrate-binding protein n=1 Tax=Haliovirga abyssi TaxID=2996794 RepID=A0AAU9DBY6_9FUSO|nr:peptide ABC transporter substrate-binding protein [Haliovirga abyssi]BDU49643.1 peptide ABC transporter substrate-binding protein [Haliovirga abyssi]
MKKRVLSIALLMTFVSAVSFGGIFDFLLGKKKEVKNLKAITVNLGQEPGSMDPQLLTDSVAIQVKGLTSEGLTRIGKDGGIMPGMAKSWEIKGNKWFFHLRDAKWSNGDSVTANDFYFGIKRAIDPATASEYAYMTYYIKGAQEFNEGKLKDFSQVGVKVIDDKTLEIELSKPAAYFASVTAFPTYLPVNEKFYNAHKEEFALEADALLFEGPFILKRWDHDSKMILVKNPNYWNKDNIKLDQVTFVMVNDTNTALNMYKNGELDIAGLSGDQLPAYKDSKDLRTYSDGSVWYFEFNTTDKLFKNVKIRKAIALAIDREALVNKIKKDGSKAGTGMVPFGFPGKTAKGFRGDYGNQLYSYNPVEAKKLFAEGLKEVGYTGPVVVSMLTGTSDGATKEAQFYQEQLRTNLGIEAKIEQVTFQIRLQRMSSKDFQIVLAGWGPDYLDPMTYMDLWVTGGGNNQTSWSNPEYDKYIETAQKSSDNAVRMDAMAAAEKILAKDFPVAVTFYRNRNRLVNPKLKGVKFRSVGSETDLYWAYLED